MGLFPYLRKLVFGESVAPKNPYERSVAEQRTLRHFTYAGLAIAIVLAWGVCYFHGGVRTVSFAAFGASLGVGGVLGFLFGVPGTSRQVVNANIRNTGPVAIDTGQGSVAKNTGLSPGASGSAPVGPDLEKASLEAGIGAQPRQAGMMQEAVNADAVKEKNGGDLPSAPPPQPPDEPSNLEQVADWVTKLLLGGGLTQMQRIPPTLWRWARLVALGILKDTPQATEQTIVAQQAFAGAVMIYGFVLGFFSGYLITKLQFGKVISGRILDEC